MDFNIIEQEIRDGIVIKLSDDITLLSSYKNTDECVLETVQQYNNLSLIGIYDKLSRYSWEHDEYNEGIPYPPYSEEKTDDWEPLLTNYATPIWLSDWKKISGVYVAYATDGTTKDLEMDGSTQIQITSPKLNTENGVMLVSINVETTEIKFYDWDEIVNDTTRKVTIEDIGVYFLVGRDKMAETWLLNDEILVDSKSYDVTYTANFTSNGVSYTSLRVEGTNLPSSTGEYIADIYYGSTQVTSSGALLSNMSLTIVLAQAATGDLLT